MIFNVNPDTNYSCLHRPPSSLLNAVCQSKFCSCDASNSLFFYTQDRAVVQKSDLISAHFLNMCYESRKDV